MNKNGHYIKTEPCLLPVHQIKGLEASDPAKSNVSYKGLFLLIEGQIKEQATLDLKNEDYFEIQKDIYGNKMTTPKKLRRNEQIDEHKLEATFPMFLKSPSLRSSNKEESYRKSKTSRPLSKQLSQISVDESKTVESISIHQSISIS